MSSWRAFHVADLIHEGVMVVGDGYRAKNDELSSGGLPFARGGNINNGFHFESADRFPIGNLTKVGEKVSKPGDVVFTSKGTVGRFAFVRETTPRFVYSPQLCYWRVLNPSLIDCRFVYYWMTSREFFAQYSGVSQQTDMAAYVSLQDQRRMKITLPPLSDQRAIAGILGALDDKIELNRKMNETLEATARAMFQSWFVDFDPVRAKVDGHAPIGMDAAWAALFPCSFENSALGEIPKGWCVNTLTNAFKVNPNRRRRLGQIAPYLDMANMPKRLPRATAVIDREAGSGARFVNGDTLVARITPCLENGKTVFVDFLSDGQVGWGSTEYIVLRPEPPIPAIYAYYIARSESFRNFAISNMTGTSGRQRVSGNSFDHYNVVVPPLAIASRFCEFADRCLAMMRANDEQSAILAEIRDTLLPKLMSGEVQMSDAGKLVGEAV